MKEHLITLAIVLAALILYDVVIKKYVPGNSLEESTLEITE